MLVQCLAGETGDANHPSVARDLTLDQVLWTRIQALPEPALRLLEVIAVSGQPIQLSEARPAVEQGLDEQGALAVLSSLPIDSQQRPWVTRRKLRPITIAFVKRP